MWFVIIGTLLAVLKALGWSVLDNWSWWWILSPFPVAAAWWTWSDASGRTKRLQMDKMDVRKAERRRRQMDALGLGTGPRGKQRPKR